MKISSYFNISYFIRNTGLCSAAGDQQDEAKWAGARDTKS